MSFSVPAYGNDSRHQELFPALRFEMILDKSTSAGKINVLWLDGKTEKQVP